MSASPLQRARRVYLNLAGSVLCFLVFIGMNLNALLITHDRTWGLISILPMVLSYVLLPRVLPTNDYDTPESQRISPDMTFRLARLKPLLTSLRVVYPLLALFVLLALPRLVPAPV